MSKVDAKSVGKLRKETGAPMMECKRALEDAGGDWDKAKDILRLKGVKAAGSKASRTASEGKVFSYVHTGDKIGVLLEIDCETDFVARNEQFNEFGQNLCLHLAFRKPPFLRREEVSPEAVEKERGFLLEQVKEQMAGKPAEIQEKAIDGRMEQFFEDCCLLEQRYIKDDSLSIEDLRKQLVATVGENVVIGRFAVFSVGD